MEKILANIRRGNVAKGGKLTKRSFTSLVVHRSNG